MIIQSLRQTLIDIARSRELAELPHPQYRRIDVGPFEPAELVPIRNIEDETEGEI